MWAAPLLVMMLSCRYIQLRSQLRSRPCRCMCSALRAELDNTNANLELALERIEQLRREAERLTVVSTTRMRISSRRSSSLPSAPSSCRLRRPLARPRRPSLSRTSSLPCAPSSCRLRRPLARPSVWQLPAALKMHTCAHDRARKARNASKVTIGPHRSISRIKHDLHRRNAPQILTFAHDRARRSYALENLAIGRWRRPLSCGRAKHA